MEQFDVVIFGAGPVGLVTALDLARRGISVLAVERSFTPTQHPKMDITNGRTMELFRTLGIAQAMRDVAVPEDHVFDVSWINRFDGHELHRFRYPSPNEYRRHARAANDGTFTAEPAMRVSQAVIEPAIKSLVEAEPLADLRYGHAGHAIESDPNGVTLTILDRRNDDLPYQVRAKYLIGCDGGGSVTRQYIGSEYEGRFQIMPRHMTHFRTKGPTLLNRWGHGWHFQSSKGTLISQNDFDTWTLHTRLPSDGSLPSPQELVRNFVGFDLEFDVLVANAWSPHLVVANRYQKDRIFLAGDSSHQYIPTGGYGMNTGVTDALNISWKIAGVIKGEFSPQILDSYEEERRTVGLRNCEYSERHNDIRVEISKAYHCRPEVFELDPAYDEARAALAKEIAVLGNLENEATGIEYGYVYHRSPLNIAPHAQEICGTAECYLPQLHPGARLPHVYDAQGLPLQDRLGQGLTLLHAPDQKEVAAALVSRLIARGLPLSMAALPETFLALFPNAQMILIRPDHHIMWSNLDCSAESAAFEALVDRVAPR